MPRSAPGASGPREFSNPKARRDFHLLERFEAGLVLRGTEVKAVRAGLVGLADAYGRVEKGEAFLYNLHIGEYAFGNRDNHLPRRPRKLLLHQKEILRIARGVDVEGMVFVPLRLYFKEALVKIELALGKGKKQFDKREDIKEREESRTIARALRHRS